MKEIPDDNRLYFDFNQLFIFVKVQSKKNLLVLTDLSKKRFIRSN